ncbi:MAG TPA: alanine racemase, partial [Fimbriimonadaceae bacterium]|nr:alanine racemase [Fimbriimonadaceae bacterium]
MPLSAIELSRANALHNVAQFRALLRPGTAMACVVKGNAYGHGMPEMIDILEPAVDYFQIDDLLELRELRKRSSKPTLVLGYVAKEEIGEALRLGCEMAIYDVERLPILDRTARELGIDARLHLKVDTYLGRQGVLPEDVSAFLDELSRYSNIKLAGVYSHFANIEDTRDFSHAQRQIDTFDAVRSLVGPEVQPHLSSTSGVLVYERDQGRNPIVRLGIGTYGMWPSEYMRLDNRSMELRPVMRWVTHVAQVKTLPVDFPVGYGLTYTTTRETRVAIIPQGYSDGYSRAFANVGRVLIRGQECPVLGRIAMNMFTADVSHLDGLRAEEEVVLL